MTESPFDLPPGPERRAAMLAEEPALNFAPEDFSDEERADFQAHADKLPEILAGMNPIRDLHELDAAVEDG